MEDLKIAREAKLKRITEVTQKLNIPEEYVEQYGKYKAKISVDYFDKIKNNKNGKLILVTSINPTPLGEGKTTTAIGLADGINRVLKEQNKSAILTLREPSMGPVFGIKGGATGGGYSQVAPMEDINLHFTGDIHAITSANNLLSAIIDNHIYHGNELKIKKIVWKRCLDVNDRELRKVEVGLSGEKNIIPRIDGFDITVASELMAILCLAKDVKDLKRRIGNIVVGYNEKDEIVTCRDLKADGSLTVLLKDAINPNIVQTLENNPVLIHGGPFANIAHGCNSVIATKMALKMGDYVVTEAGFGADLGAEKFLNIKSRLLEVSPDCVVIVATLRALKYHGGASKEEAEKANMEALKIGINNLKKHINNIKSFGLNTVVAINKFSNDDMDEIEFLKDSIEKECPISLLNNWQEGSKGAIDLAYKVIENCELPYRFTNTYELKDSIYEKIEKVSKNIYGASSIELSKEAMEDLKRIEKMNVDYPVCIAKTQYSFSDDAKNLLCDKPYSIHINSIELKNGAEFILVKTGKIMTMPGLSKNLAAEKIDIDENGEIVGLF